jgi:Cys-rich repeat protein
MKRTLWCLGLLVLLACAPRPEIPTADLGKDCASDTDCAQGQTCHAWAHPDCEGQQCQTCEIECAADSDCPEGFHCNLPPLLPDTAVNTCAQD